jgi:glycerophosphoryl diester phosphodiesterase
MVGSKATLALMSEMPLLVAASLACTATAVAIWGRTQHSAAAPKPRSTPHASSGRRMKIVGHRGASHVSPENTLHAIRLALASGAGFEVDLQVTKDGEVVVLHDDTLRRTAACRPWARLPLIGDARLDAPIGELSLAEARKVCVGDRTHTEPLPLFADVLAQLRAPPTLDAHASHPFAHCFAELKSDGMDARSGFDARLTAKAVDEVRAAGIGADQLTWISFSLDALLYVKRRKASHSALLIQYVASEAEAWDAARLAVSSGVDGIDLQADPSVLSAELVEWLHARGKKVAVWVYKAPAANDVERVWEALEARGVDYLTSNLPPALLEWQQRG